MKIDYAPRTIRQRIAGALRLPACKAANHYGVLCARRLK